MTLHPLRSSLSTLAFAAVLLCSPAQAQAPKPPPVSAPKPVEGPATPSFTPQEVGIDEKLGTTVPLDLVLNDEDGQPVTLR